MNKTFKDYKHICNVILNVLNFHVIKGAISVKFEDRFVGSKLAVLGCSCSY
jgi:hypothetical protein